MPENVMFTIVDNGYDIGEINNYVSETESLRKAYEEQAANYDRLSKERDELFKNCVAFAKRIKSLEKQRSEENDAFVEQDGARERAVMTDDGTAAISELPSDATNFDELFNLLNSIDNETSSYVNDFKSAIENAINQVIDMAKSVLEYAHAEKERILEAAHNDAEKLLNENKKAKIKFELAYKQLGETLIDLNAVMKKDD
ncbi:MAG: hypothetical protein GX824_02370 [Clostridiales bacterium]|nr:hypothetical protein [Clostridiales bacterium]